MGTGMKVGVERTDVGAGEPWGGGWESQGAGLAVRPGGRKPVL